MVLSLAACGMPETETKGSESDTVTAAVVTREIPAAGAAEKEEPQPAASGDLALISDEPTEPEHEPGAAETGVDEPAPVEVVPVEVVPLEPPAEDQGSEPSDRGVPSAESGQEPDAEHSEQSAQNADPEPEPEPEPETITYVLNRNTRKFHEPGCSSVKTIKDSNRIDFTGTREEVVAMGYEPCGRCKP